MLLRCRIDLLLGHHEGKVRYGEAAEDQSEDDNLSQRELAYITALFETSIFSTYHSLVCDGLDEAVEYLRKRMCTDPCPGHFVRISVHTILPVLA